MEFTGEAVRMRGWASWMQNAAVKSRSPGNEERTPALSTKEVPTIAEDPDVGLHAHARATP